MIHIEPLPQPTKGMTRNNLIHEEPILFKFHSNITKKPLDKVRTANYDSPHMQKRPKISLRNSSI